MDTETAKPATILEIAWTRHAHLDTAAGRRTKAFYDIRKWITLLGVLATFFAIITQVFFPNQKANPTLLGLIAQIFLVATPILASILASFATKFYSNGAWLIYRSGGEEIKKEIYFFRTYMQKDPARRAYLERRLTEIQRQMFRSLSGEFAFEKYDGPVPKDYSPQDPNSDPGFNDLTGDEYFRYRLEHQLDWHNRKVNQFKFERRRMTIFILTAGGMGAVFAAWGGGLSLWVALTASITAALIGWEGLKNLDTTIKNYSKVVMELTILYDHWQNLEGEERTAAEFKKLVLGCENVLWAQNVEYIKSMQEALKESDLDKESGLIEGVIKESVESAERTQQATAEAIVNQTKETLQEGEKKIDETVKATLGSLAEEASSEMVQKELEAMQKAASEMVENVVAKVTSFSSHLADIAKEFAHIEIGRDTSKAQLNAILARYPKSNDVKG